MISTCHYESPLGGILLAADEMGLTGLWFDGEKYLADQLPAVHRVQEPPVLTAAKRWLDIYFSGGQPDFLPPLHPVGSAFQQSVWRFPMDKRLPTVKLHSSLQRSRDLPECLHRLWAEPLGTTKSPLSFPATGWWAQMGASPDMQEGSTKR